MNDPAATFGTAVSIERQITEIEKLLSTRRRLLRRLVEDGGMSPGEMAKRLRPIEAVLITLQRVQKAQQP
jgi:hypothetical protein